LKRGGCDWDRNMKTIDLEYQTSKRFVSEYPHKYGENVHILADPVLIHLTAVLSNQETNPQQLPSLIRHITQFLLYQALSLTAPLKNREINSRMTSHHDAGRFSIPQFDDIQKYVIVSLARAGILPAQHCYETVQFLIGTGHVWQDHFLCERTVGPDGHVDGTAIAGHKVGGKVDDAIIIIPDPMGATGNTLCTVLDFYKQQKLGTPKKVIALHAIVSPEYLKRISRDYPEVIIVTARLDRGLSAPQILNTSFGEQWDREKGLDQHDYIVPGAGGVGELLNNTAT
jgi:uracil phosphoribosyltransferase